MAVGLEVCLINTKHVTQKNQETQVRQIVSGPDPKTKMLQFREIGCKLKRRAGEESVRMRNIVTENQRVPSYSSNCIQQYIQENLQTHEQLGLMRFVS
jgi:hypothetical protein